MPTALPSTSLDGQAASQESLAAARSAACIDAGGSGSPPVSPSASAKVRRSNDACLVHDHELRARLINCMCRWPGRPAASTASAAWRLCL